MIIDFQLAEQLKEKPRDRTLIFTDGVFDLLHLGHVAFLESLQEMDGEVIVCVLSDEWAKKKGPDRPIFPQAQRAAMVDALRAVSYVMLAFDQETQKRIPISSVLRRIRPDIFATTDDSWASHEREFNALGIELRVVPRVSVGNISTSETIRRIKE